MPSYKDKAGVTVAAALVIIIAALAFVLYQPITGFLLFDTTPPSVNITRPAVEEVVNENIVFVSYEESGRLDEVSHVVLRLDSRTEISDMDNDGSYIFVNVNNGVHSLHIWMVNSTGDKLTNPEAHDNITFTVDTTIPAINNVGAVSVTHKSANIVWTTNQLTDSLIRYGTDTGMEIKLTFTNLTTEHSFVIPELKAQMLYYFRVESCNTEDKCASSGVYNFTTKITPLAEEKESTRFVDVIPNTTLRDNNQLREATARLLGVDSLNEESVNAMLETSENVSPEFSCIRHISAVEGKTNLSMNMKYEGNRELKNVIVYDILPKEFAENAENITVDAPGSAHEVVNPDPEYAFFYPNITPGQEITITYHLERERDISAINRTNTTVYADNLGMFACNSNNLCEAERGENIANCPNDCIVTSCSPEETRCSGNKLEVCNPEGNAWVISEVCGYGCDSMLLVCNPEPLSLEESYKYAGFMAAIVVIIIVLYILFYGFSGRHPDEEEYEEESEEEDEEES
jgi:hypothetical protein